MKMKWHNYAEHLTDITEFFRALEDCLTSNYEVPKPSELERIHEKIVDRYRRLKEYEISSNPTFHSNVEMILCQNLVTMRLYRVRRLLIESRCLENIQQYATVLREWLNDIDVTYESIDRLKDFCEKEYTSFLYERRVSQMT